MSDFEKFIDDLKQRANIVDVLSNYAQPVRKGGRYFVCCPLHVEKTPSMCLYEDTNTYHCFGCHKGGDAISFIEDIEKTDFMGAVEILAKKYNMEIPKIGKSEDFGQAKRKRDRLYSLTREVGLYYHNNLMGPQGEKAREYLTSRGLSTNTINKFGLGYSVTADDMPQYLLKKGYTPEEMAEARVAYSNAKGKLYDPQHERFVTPIINSTKNIVAFGGRIIRQKGPNDAKYYNSMESVIFHKSNELFGQNLIKEQRNITNVVLVEGYMDVISLYQAGIHNAVASMGTALTPDQAKTIKRYVNKVYYMYDGDDAGQHGMQRGVDILKDAGLDVRVVVLEDNLDPDEYIKKFGAEAMKNKIYNDSMPMYEYKLRVLEKECDMQSPEGRGDYATKAIDVIKVISNPAQIEPMILYIERRSSISSKYLMQQLDNAKKGEKVVIKPAVKKVVNSKEQTAIRFILYCIFGGVENLKVADEYYECLTMPEHIELYNIFRAATTSLTLDDLEELSSENSEVEEILKVGRQYSDETMATKFFYDCRRLVMKNYVEEKRNEIVSQLENVQDEDSKQMFIIQLAKLNEYAKKIK